MKRGKKAALLVISTLVMALAGCSTNEEQPSVERLTQATDLADYSSYVTLGQYTDLNIMVAEASVSQEALQDRMDRTVDAYNYFFADNQKNQAITDRAIALDDTINMDYTATVDGEDMALLSGSDVSYVVGSEEVEPSLDVQMVGLMPGNTYDLVCTFGEDTAFTELSGKTVTFHVTVNYIYGEANPLLWGDELVTIMSNGRYTDAEEYKEYLYQELLQDALEVQRQEYKDALWETILADCTFSAFPEDVIEENAENYYTQTKALYEYYATYYSYSYDVYMEEIQGMTDEEFHALSYDYARVELERIYTAVTIFRAQNMAFSDEDFSRGVAELAEEYGYDSSAEFVEKYGEEYVREVLVTQIVEEYLLENNNMVVENDG